MSGVPADHIYEARLLGDRLHCGRCDVMSVPLGGLKCKPTAECGLTLAIVRDVLETEASRIDASVNSAFRVARAMQAGEVFPNREGLRHAAAMRAGVRLLERILGDKDLMERLRRAANG